MSLIKCKKVYKKGEDVSYLSALPLSELRKIDGITICQGFMMEAAFNLDPTRKITELLCVHCGRRIYFDTRRYIKVLKSLGIDYSRRLP